MNVGGDVHGQVVIGDHNTVTSISGPGPVPDPAPAPAPDVDVRVFISYRRDDADGHAGRLRDWLPAASASNGCSSTWPASTPARTSSARCDVVLVVIGRQWLAIAGDDGRRRLDDPEDWVRLEVALALERRIPVVPVLVRGAKMPAAADLPEPLKALALRNAIEIGPQWGGDVERLADAIARARSDDR